MRPLGLRSRLTLLVAIGATIVIAALTVGFNLILRSSLDADAGRVVRSRAESALETVAVGRNGEPRLIEAPAAQDAGVGVWVFGADGAAIERPPATPAAQELADELAGTDGEYRESDSHDLRLYSLAVRDPAGEQVATVVGSVSVEPYEKTEKGALIASVIFAALVLIGIVAVSRLLVDRSLRPVARMTREATDWSEHDLDHRFGAGEPHDELTELAAAFDSMLDRLASSLRHEQRLTAEISHELRTPLTAIIAETELALARSEHEEADAQTLARVAERAAELRRILETLLAAARAQIDAARPGARVAEVLDRMMAAADGSGGIRVVRSAPFDAEALADVDPALLERVVAPLIENGVRYASAAVRVSVSREDGRVLIGIADDGPGVPDEERERIFEPGERGAAAAGGGGPGEGLGLALSRRLAIAAGGGLLLGPRPAAGGARFELVLPAEPGTGTHKQSGT